MRVAALQFDVQRGEVDHNLVAVRAGLELARAAQVELVVLPEMWSTSFPTPELDLAALVAGAERAEECVARWSQELGLAVAGSGFARAPERPTNRLTLFDRGERVFDYDKVHLFSPTAETEVFSAGAEPPPTRATRFGRIGGFVCYDLRFPELTRRCFEDAAELLLIPAQWPDTRAAHFRALAVAAAVLGQCFVVASNRIGREVIGRRELELVFPGNSLIVDPHGNVLAEGRGQEGLTAAEIDLEQARRMRRTVPVARDRRPELYARWPRTD